MFPWQAGDVLMLDNMLVAHARTHKGLRGGAACVAREPRTAKGGSINGVVSRMPVRAVFGACGAVRQPSREALVCLEKEL